MCFYYFNNFKCSNLDGTMMEINQKVELSQTQYTICYFIVGALFIINIILIFFNRNERINNIIAVCIVNLQVLSYFIFDIGWYTLLVSLNNPQKATQDIENTLNFASYLSLESENYPDSQVIQEIKAASKDIFNTNKYNDIFLNLSILNNYAPSTNLQILIRALQIITANLESRVSDLVDLSQYQIKKFTDFDSLFSSTRMNDGLRSLNLINLDGYKPYETTFDHTYISERNSTKYNLSSFEKGESKYYKVEIKGKNIYFCFVNKKIQKVLIKDNSNPEITIDFVMNVPIYHIEGKIFLINNTLTIELDKNMKIVNLLLPKSIVFKGYWNNNFCFYNGITIVFNQNSSNITLDDISVNLSP